MTTILQEIKFWSEAFIDVRFIHENTVLQLLKDYQRCSWIQLVWEKMVHKSEYLEESRPSCTRVGVPRTILPEDVTEPTTGIKFPTLLEDNSNRTAVPSSGNSSGRRRSCSGEDGDLVQGAEDLAVAAAGGAGRKPSRRRQRRSRRQGRE